MTAESGGSGLNGEVRSWVDTLTDWAVDLGFDTYIFWPTRAPLAQLESFAIDVAPAVRDAVSGRRRAPAAAGVADG
jgi:hypothetical protein